MHAVWQRTLTEQAELGQHHILRLAWRPSTRGGREWVVPQHLSPVQRAQLSGDWLDAAGLSRSAVHVQIRGDTTLDPAPWQVWLQEKLAPLLPGSQRWHLGAPCDDSSEHCIAAIPGTTTEWDGGLVVTANTPAEAAAVARLLGQLCVGGAGGSSRLAVRLTHDLQEHPTSPAGSNAAATQPRRPPGKGGRVPGRAGRGPA